MSATADRLRRYAAEARVAANDAEAEVIRLRRASMGGTGQMAQARSDYLVARATADAYSHAAALVEGVES